MLCHTSRGHRPDHRGQQHPVLRSDRLTFKDLLCFLPFPLANFPATFGIEELCKGFFPHTFNTLEIQDYEGPMPDVSYYDPEGMSSKKKAEFERWYTEKVASNYRYVMRREMETYCESDVELLKAGCRKFHKEFKQRQTLTPWRSASPSLSPATYSGAKN